MVSGPARIPIGRELSVASTAATFLVVIYVFVLPVVLAKAAFKTFYEKLGPPRYYVAVFLFLMMMSLPMKMLARWLFNLKYIVHIGEYFFNI